MNKLVIYLGDLSYDTVALSNEGFPINIGYIAGYAKKIFGDLVEIKLYKYIKDLESALYNNPPDILGLSNYAWNHQISYKMFELYKKTKPNGICVWGGVNFPLDLKSQKDFMEKYHLVDAYVPLEGEIGFANLIHNVLEQKPIIKIDGCITMANDIIEYGIDLKRMKTLDEIPSPYLTGLMDKFFDGKLSPMLQTNRGCPFSCTFCVDGKKEVSQVNMFSMQRVKAELDYIAKHVPEKTDSMIITDLNFGMMPRDLEICDHLSMIQKKYNYPLEIQATTGKNSKEKIIKAIGKLNGALRLWLSVQSMDEIVLKSIKRDNISVDHMLALEPELKKSGLGTRSEVILGLPNETYQSHIETLKKLTKAKVNYIDSYTLMLLNGTELNTPEQREKYGLKTKFRVIPRDFVELSDGSKVIEVEEVVVETNTLKFEEYVELRVLAFAMFAINKGIVFDSMLKFLYENDIDVFDVFHKVVSEINNSSPEIKNIFKRFENSTKKELFDSLEIINSYYQKPENYAKLLSGDAGINNMQYFYAEMASSHMPDMAEYLSKIIMKLLDDMCKSYETMKQFMNIMSFCSAISENPLGIERNNHTPVIDSDYDISSWLADLNNRKLDFFEKKTRYCFVFDEIQYNLVQNKIDIFGNSGVGLAQVVKRIPTHMLWRKPILQKFTGVSR